MLVIKILTTVTILSLMPIAGIIFLLKMSEPFYKKSFYAMGFSAGTLIGSAALHLLPHVFRITQYASIPFLCGFLLFFALTIILTVIEESGTATHHFIALYVIGDFFGNFLDGITLAASFAISTKLGVVAALAIALHEIPEELANFASMLAQGIKPRVAIGLNLLSTSAAFLGAFGTYYLGAHMTDKVNMLLAVAAGAFLYLGTVQLLGILQQKQAKSSLSGQVIACLLGVTVIWFLEVLLKLD